MKTLRIACPDCGADLSDHLSVCEVARMLHYEDESVRGMLKSGRIAGFKLSGAWRVCPRDLQKAVRDGHNLLGPEAA